jgi:hypothetical protein
MRDGAMTVEDPRKDVSDNAAHKRRQRARNWAMLAVLVGLVILFYAITIVQMSRGSH